MRFPEGMFKPRPNLLVLASVSIGNCRLIFVMFQLANDGPMLCQQGNRESADELHGAWRAR